MSEVLEITPQQYDIIADIQQKILAKLAVDEPAIDILNLLCSLAENALSNAVASIMLVDKATNLMSVLCAPSIPQKGHDALANLQPGPQGGSCGNAVFYNEGQFVLNTFEDKRWQNIRHIAFDFNLCSCWSVPIRDKNDQVIGTFALSSFEHRAPTVFHKKTLEICSAIVSVILKKQQKEERLSLLLIAINNTSDGFLVTDNKNLIVEVNSAFECILGFNEQEVLGRDITILSSAIHDATFYQQLWHSLDTQGKWRGEITNKHRNGDYVTQWMSITVIKDEQGEVQNYLYIFSDLTELKTTQQQIVDMAFYDSLTGLRNKTFLEQQISDSNDNHTLILLNINNFNYLNTAYGFDVGDSVLKS
ncbi:MAG: PAS domain S-box protein, partial [Colwellia sp.]|nr:PAS domain S-box protein [Colwellia sp.]